MAKGLIIGGTLLLLIATGCHSSGGAQEARIAPDQPHKITLHWEKAARAVSYNVYRRNYRSQEYSKVGTVDAPTYEDPSVKSGERYCYQVSSVDGKGNESPRSPEMCQSVPRP